MSEAYAHGFVRVNATARSLGFEDGTSFHPYGSVYYTDQRAFWIDDYFRRQYPDRFRSDFETMRRLGLNTAALFYFPQEDMIKKGDFALLDKIEQVIRLGTEYGIFFILAVMPTAYYGLPSDEDFTGADSPVINAAARERILKLLELYLGRLKDERAIIGFMLNARLKFGQYPPLIRTWQAWLRQRYQSLGNLREAWGTDVGGSWDDVPLPGKNATCLPATEDPGTFDYVSMATELAHGFTREVYREFKSRDPNHLMVLFMEGCEHDSLLTGEWFESRYACSHTLEPSLLAADAIWHEYYPCMGFASTPRTIESQGNIGVAYNLVRMMKKMSGLPLLICSGVALGRAEWGFPTEFDQDSWLDRYLGLFHHAGADGVFLWNFRDDWYARGTKGRSAGRFGEALGLLRPDGSHRPVTEAVRKYAGARRAPAPRTAMAPTVALLLPTAESYRPDRGEVIRTAGRLGLCLLRCGVLHDFFLTGTGRTSLACADLEGYQMVFIGSCTYERDFLPMVEETLVHYVEKGGRLFVPAHTLGGIKDPHGLYHKSPGLMLLTGVTGERLERSNISECTIGFLQWRVEQEFGGIPAGQEGLWALRRFAGPCDARGILSPSADVLVSAWLDYKTQHPTEDLPKQSEKLGLASPADHHAAAQGYVPLLYRVPVGKGRVYVWTGSLDIFRWKGAGDDYNGKEWLWILGAIIRDAGIAYDPVGAIATSLTWLPQEERTS